MALTQKYKQQQQQARVQTNEGNYVKGMYFSNVPLAEGYSRILMNFEIDNMSGRIVPRKGLQTLGTIKPVEVAQQYLNNHNGFNTVVQSKVCAASDSADPRKINRYLQSILYNTDSRALLVATCDPEISANNYFKVSPFSIDSAAEYIAPEPFVIANPGVHGKTCSHNNFFKRPVGTFAFNGNFYVFLRRNNYVAVKLGDIPNTTYNYSTYEALATAVPTGTPGNYFVFVSGDSAGTIAYYKSNGDIDVWPYSEDALIHEQFPAANETNILCYSKLGSEIQNDEILLDTTLSHDSLEPDKYYVCVVQPLKINPTEATSWGYNMLLDHPYDFICENTAVNSVTILGVIPYDRTGSITLTPRKNQEITLKAYYRAPSAYYSDAQNARYYATTSKKITVTTSVTQLAIDSNGNYSDGTHTVYYGYIITSANSPTIKRYYYLDDNDTPVIVNEDDLTTETISVTETRNPTNHSELTSTVTSLVNYNFGDWWYCENSVTASNILYPAGYYMVVPGATLNDKQIKYFGDAQPAASERLTLAVTGTETKLRIHWQMRSAGASTWTDLYNETIKLSDYYIDHGDHAPFTITTTMPDDEVLIRLTISDTEDVVSNEEYVLSTNTIGLSLVSDELANTLNLNAKNFDLGRATGMCEWEQRLVLWGVPGALNTVFVSDINNPGFFPYPNNVDIFPDPIISVHNYGDELLVLTTSALYRLIWDTEGGGWSHKLVQQNLHVTESDTYLSCVIKNMFFFKSGDYYYMMVPKATSKAAVRGDVAIAPIAKPIERLLDNFHEEVYNLIKVMSDTPSLQDFTNNLVNYFSYVDNTKVVVNYVYDLNATIGNTESITNSSYLYIQLVYDTDARTWTMRAFEAPHMLYASHSDAIQQDRFIDVTPILDRNQIVLQYYKFINRADMTTQYIDAENTAVAHTAGLKNYQYLDTGNREINTELKKRFREFQFKLKNNTATNLGFYTSFLVDGSLRKDLQHYSPRYITDETTGEDVVIIERVLDTTTMAYNTSRIERVIVPTRMLQDGGELDPTITNNPSDADRWILNQSAFPGRTFWKIRMPISGKGYTPRAILLSTNELDYELVGHTWVYRAMNGR